MLIPRLISLVSFVLLLVASSAASLEFIARFVIGLGTPPLSRADTKLEYFFAPNQELRRFHNRISINRYGMRSPDFEPLLPTGQRRVLVLGDSVLFGGSTLDQAQIATTLLATKLGPGVVVGNVSAGSWGPGNWLGWIQRYGLLGATDVILLTSSHDLFDHPTFAPLNPLTHPTRNPPSASWELWHRYLAPRIWPVALSHAVTTPIPSVSFASGSSEELGLSDLARLVSVIRRGGASLIVVQFWERNELETGVLRSGYAQQRELFIRLGVPVFDAGPLMLQCAEDAGKPLASLYVDQIHPFTPLGQSCLAHALHKALISGSKPL